MHDAADVLDGVYVSVVCDHVGNFDDFKLALPELLGHEIGEELGFVFGP